MTLKESVIRTNFRVESCLMILPWLSIIYILLEYVIQTRMRRNETHPRHNWGSSGKRFGHRYVRQTPRYQVCQQPNRDVLLQLKACMLRLVWTMSKLSSSNLYLTPFHCSHVSPPREQLRGMGATANTAKADTLLPRVHAPTAVELTEFAGIGATVVVAADRASVCGIFCNL